MEYIGTKLLLGLRLSVYDPSGGFPKIGVLFRGSQGVI